MDGDGGLLQNWGYYESSLVKGHVAPQMMPSNMEDRKPLLVGRDTTLMANVNGGFNPRDCGVPSLQYHPMNNWRGDSWIHSHHRDTKFLNMLPSNSSCGILHDPTAHYHPHHHSVQMLHQPESSSDDRAVNMDEIVAESSSIGPAKKRSVGKPENGPKTKKAKKGPNDALKDGSSASVHRAKAAKKVTEVVINGINMDISSIPIPICSCTGTPQQCYRWGSGGWQSACCTTGMSVYPLPFSLKRRGARIAGRKMSLGAFKKVLEKLAAEGYNFSNPIDLKTYWAKHGTNKFVTIR